MKFTSRTKRLLVPITKPVGKDGTLVVAVEARFNNGTFETDDTFIAEYLDKRVPRCELVGEIVKKEIEPEKKVVDFNNLPDDKDELKAIGDAIGCKVNKTFGVDKIKADLIKCKEAL